MFSNSRSVFLAILLGVSCSSFALAQRSWDGGNATFVWGDNGNWDPDGSPTAQAISIGDLAAAANDTTLLDTDNSINSLTITNGADVENSTDNGATTEFQLIVNGATTIANAGSSITVYGAAGDGDGLDTDTLTISSQATLFLNSQTAVGMAIVEVDSGAITNNANGSIVGNGLIELIDAPAAVTTLLNNEGTLTAGNIGFLLNIPPRTLQITATSANARVDLDGAVGGAGVVNVNTNATLDIDVPISDGFGGDLNLLAGATLNISSPWTINGGTVDVNTPPSGIQVVGPPAHLAGGLIVFSGGTITLDDDGDSLEIDAEFIGAGGVINNTGTIIFTSTSTIGNTTDFNMLGDADLVVNDILNIATPGFDLDAFGPDGTTTVNAGGILNLDLGAGADLDLDHTINLNGGELDLTSSAATSWRLSSIGTINAVGGATSTINSAGETFQMDGDVNVTDNSTLVVNSVSSLTGTNVVIEAGSTLIMGTVTYAGGSYTGDGVFRKGTATITADTTWNVSTIDLDDGNTTLNADLTIFADAYEAESDGVDGTHTINDGALLTLNGTDSGWRLDPGGTIVYNGNASAETYLAGFEVIMNGTINHTGDGRTEARLDIWATGVVNILTAGEPLRLSGGNNTNDPNRIINGTINGPGILGADTGSALHGFGTIDADIDFDGTANLKADNGVLSLTVGTAIIDVNEIGTADDDGTLSVGSPWNTNVAASVRLNGGQLVGATITNNGAAGINGFGTLSAQVNNNTRIDAENGTLIVETPLNNNDWDGTGNAGDLNAISGNLEIRDSAAFLFNGGVQVNAGNEVFANGFELEFEPASTLTLNAGTYRAEGTNHFGGTITVGAGTSEITVTGTAIFESTSSTTLTGTLRVNSPVTQIDAGATFAGGGTLLNTESNFLRLQDGADVHVLVQNQGDLIIGTTGPAQATGLDYQQDATGMWLVNLNGLALNQFDRYTLTGTSSLAGNLIIDLGGGYMPALGDTFNILSAVGGVTGSFDALTQPASMPAGLFFGLAYQATFAQLVVIDHLPGDYNKNGVVDAADYTLWRDTLGQVITALSGADGNGNGMVDASDYTFWKSHFGQTLGLGATGFASATPSVPEPASLMLIILAALSMSTRRR